MKRRSVDEIRATGAQRITDHEVAWLCDLAKTFAACAMSTVAITPSEAERQLAGTTDAGSASHQRWLGRGGRRSNAHGERG